MPEAEQGQDNCRATLDPKVDVTPGNDQPIADEQPDIAAPETVTVSTKRARSERVDAADPKLAAEQRGGRKAPKAATPKADGPKTRSAPTTDSGASRRFGHSRFAIPMHGRS